jgi:hypothetical protein
MVANIIFGRRGKGLSRLNQVGALRFDVDWVVLLHGDFAGIQFDFTHAHQVHQLCHFGNRRKRAKTVLFRSLLFLNLCMGIGLCRMALC